MNKDKVIRLRVSEEEHRFYKLAAKRNNMTLSAMIRSFLLTGFPSSNQNTNSFTGKEVTMQTITQVATHATINNLGNTIIKGKKSYKPNLEKKY